MDVEGWKDDVQPSAKNTPLHPLPHATADCGVPSRDSLLGAWRWDSLEAQVRAYQIRQLTQLEQRKGTGLKNL